jgi:hypothetical protein
MIDTLNVISEDCNGAFIQHKQVIPALDAVNSEYRFLENLKIVARNYPYHLADDSELDGRKTVDFFWYYFEILRTWKFSFQNSDILIKEFMAPLGRSIQIDQFNHGLVLEYLQVISNSLIFDVIEIKAAGIPNDEKLRFVRFFTSSGHIATSKKAKIRVSGTAEQVAELLTIADELILEDYNKSYQVFTASFNLPNIKSVTIKYSDNQFIPTYQEIRGESFHLEIERFWSGGHDPSLDVIRSIDSIRNCFLYDPMTWDMMNLIRYKCNVFHYGCGWRYIAFGKNVQTSLLDLSLNQSLEDLTLTGVLDITKLKVPARLKSLSFQTPENYVLPMSSPVLSKQLKSITILPNSYSLWRDMLNFYTFHMLNIFGTVNLQQNLAS